MPTDIKYAHIVGFREKFNPAKRPDDGYGDKIPTDYQVQIGHDSGLPSGWLKVYAICYSNAASLYVNLRGEKMFLRDGDLQEHRNLFRSHNKETM